MEMLQYGVGALERFEAFYPAGTLRQVLWIGGRRALAAARPYLPPVFDDDARSLRRVFSGHCSESLVSGYVRDGCDADLVVGRGEFVATATGVEGSLIYAVSALLRDEIEATGKATFELDLLPAFSPERVLEELRHPRGSRSLSSHLKSRLHIDGIKAAMLYEQLTKEEMLDPVVLARGFSPGFCGGYMPVIAT